MDERQIKMRCFMCKFIITNVIGEDKNIMGDTFHSQIKAIFLFIFSLVCGLGYPLSIRYSLTKSI